MGTLGSITMVITIESLSMGFRQEVLCRAHIVEHVRAGLPDILAGRQAEDI